MNGYNESYQDLSRKIIQTQKRTPDIPMNRKDKFLVLILTINIFFFGFNCYWAFAKREEISQCMEILDGQ